MKKFETMSQFNRFVKPTVYHTLHKKVGELLNVTMEDIVDKGGSLWISLKNLYNGVENLIFFAHGAVWI